MIAKSKGGAFLIEDLSPDQIFTAEDLFWAKEVEPKAELGLTAITLPEQHGGMELDLASAIVAAEHLARDGSYSMPRLARAEVSARSVPGACAEGEGLHTNVEVLRRLASHDPVNAVALRRRIASRHLERERYLAG